MNKKNQLFFCCLAVILCVHSVNAQVTIGADQSPSSFSVLELISNNNKGLRLPQMTTDQREAITTAEFKANPLASGLHIYNTDTGCEEYWNGEKWVSLCDDTTTYTFAFNDATRELTITPIVGGTAGTPSTVTIPAGGGNGTVYTGSTSVTLNGTSFQRAALTGDATAAENSNAVTVTGLQGKGISATAPTNGQVLKFDGTNWTPAADANGTGIAQQEVRASNGLEYKPTVIVPGILDQIDVTLGGTLTENTVIATTNTQSGTTYNFSVTGNGEVSIANPTVKMGGLPSTANTGTMSMLVKDNSTGQVYTAAVPSAAATVQANNGLKKSGDYVQLGGTLIENTNIAQGNFNLTTTTGTGKVGIGTTTPRTRLDIAGAATNTRAYPANGNGTGTNIDFSQSNLAYTNAQPQNNFTLSGMQNGGTYTLAVQGQNQGTATFVCPGFNAVKSANNGQTQQGRDTIYTFLAIGSTVYFWMNTGF